MNDRKFTWQGKEIVLDCRPPNHYTPPYRVGTPDADMTRDAHGNPRNLVDFTYDCLWGGLELPMEVH